jgi:hypothetical protein
MAQCILQEFWMQIFAGNTITYSSTGDQNITGTTYHHLIASDANGGNSKTLGGNTTVNGDFTITNSTYFDPMGSDFTALGSTTIAGIFDDDAAGGTSNLQNVDLSGGQIYGGADGIVNINGTLTFPTGDARIGRVVLTVSDSTIVENGRTLLLNPANGTKTFNDVLVNGIWNNTSNESITISGNLTTNSSAAFNAGTARIFYRCQ